MATRKYHKKNTRKNTRKTLARQKGGAAKCAWDVKRDIVTITGDSKSLFYGKTVADICRDEIKKGMQKKATSKSISKKSPPKHRSLIMPRRSSAKPKNTFKTTSLDGYLNNKSQKINPRTLRNMEKNRIIAENPVRVENVKSTAMPNTEDVDNDNIQKINSSTLRNMEKKRSISKQSPPKHHNLIMPQRSSVKPKNILKTASLDGYLNTKPKKINPRTLRRREKLRIMAEKIARGEKLKFSDMPSTEDSMEENDRFGQYLHGRREADERDSETEEEKNERLIKKAADRAKHDKSLAAPNYTK